MSVIAVHDLHKRYKDTVAVADVSFTVEPGEIFGILGRNGAGKTTTVECITGMRKPDAGTIEVLGLDPQRDRAELRERVGIQLQASRVFDRITVIEAMRLFASFYTDPADPEELVALMGLSDRRDVAFSALSGGQQQRLSVALALVGRPEVAVLDELTTGLDPRARRDTWEVVEAIRDRGVTIVLVSHFMEEVERLCDRVAILEAGRVVGIDSPAGLVAQLGGAQRVAFTTAQPVDHDVLRALPGVETVEAVGPEVEVTGGGELLSTVTSALAAHRIRTDRLTSDRAGLEDVFLALTGHRISRDDVEEAA